MRVAMDMILGVTRIPTSAPQLPYVAECALRRGPGLAWEGHRALA
jgi:hypothetical protein